MKYGPLFITIVSPCLFVYGFFLHSCQDPAAYVPAKQHLSAVDLVRGYDESEARSDSNYLYKVISVSGLVRKIFKNEAGHYVTVLGSEGGVDCSMDSLYDHHPLPVQLGDSITIRGTCVGRLTNVILIQCIIEK